MEDNCNKKFNCHCRRRCGDKFTIDQHKTIFDSFWNLENYSIRNGFIRNLVQRKNINRSRGRDGTGAAKYYTYMNTLLQISSVENPLWPKRYD